MPTTKTQWPQTAEVLMDISRIVGERRLCREGDSRDDYPTMCQWADEFQDQYDSNPDACETYYEDVEAFTLAKAAAHAFVAFDPAREPQHCH